MNSISAGFVALSKYDYVQFWEITSASEKPLGAVSPDQKEKRVEEVVHDLLSAGLRPVTYRDGNFRLLFPTERSIHEYSQEILRLWRELGHQPGLGDVCWFAPIGWREGDVLPRRQPITD